MKRFDETYRFLTGMYHDGYFPDFLVDKIRAELENMVAFLETGVSDLGQIQEKFDRNMEKSFVSAIICCGAKDFFVGRDDVWRLI